MFEEDLPYTSAVIAKTVLKKGIFHHDYQPSVPKMYQNTWAIGAHYAERCQLFACKFKRYGTLKFSSYVCHSNLVCLDGLELL